ncbi:unnamed protein product [Closterium sp. Yama58-4]|nr:unnamed protein product [Closterium sp. Yama58-4]
MGAAAGCDGGERAGGGEARSESDGGGEGERWCGICLDDVGARALQQGALDCCDHLFCFPCILKWSQVPAPARHCAYLRISRSFSRIASHHRDSVTRCIASRSRTVDTEADAELAAELASADLAAAAAGGALEPYSDAGCMECGGSSDERLLLLCDRCDGAAHTYCVGLGSSVPRGDWLCPPCVSALARLLAGDAQHGAQGAQGGEGAAVPGRGGRAVSRERGGGMGLGGGGGVGSSVVADSDEGSGWEDDEDVEDGGGEYASEEDEDEDEAGVAARQRQQVAQLRSNNRWSVAGAGAGVRSQQASSSAGSYGGLAAAAATAVPAAAAGGGGGPMRVSPPSIHDIVSPALPSSPAGRHAALHASAHSRGGVGNASAVGGRASGAEEDERAWRQFERARMAAAALGRGAAASLTRSAARGGAMVEGGRGAGLVGGGARGLRGGMAGRAPAALVPLRGAAVVHGSSGSRSGRDGDSTASLCASTSAASGGSSLVSSALLAASRALAAKQAAASAATSSSLPPMPSLSSLSTPSVPSLPPAPLCPARPPTMPRGAACERRALQVNGSDAGRCMRTGRGNGTREEGRDSGEGTYVRVGELGRKVKAETGVEEGERGCGMLSSGEKVAQGGGEWRGVKVECCAGDDAADRCGSGRKVAQGPSTGKADDAAGSAEEERSAWARGEEGYGVRSCRATGNTDGGSSSLVPLGRADRGSGEDAVRGATKGGTNDMSASGESKGGGGGRGDGEVKPERGTGSRSSEGAREEREAVVRAVKRYLHPLYTNKTIGREQFKHVARAATHLFWDRMGAAPPALAASPSLFRVDTDQMLRFNAWIGWVGILKIPFEWSYR